MLTYTYTYIYTYFDCRIDTGDDRRISKEEFTSDALKEILEKVGGRFYIF